MNRGASCVMFGVRGSWYTIFLLLFGFLSFWYRIYRYGIVELRRVVVYRHTQMALIMERAAALPIAPQFRQQGRYPLTYPIHLSGRRIGPRWQGGLVQ